MEVSEMLVEVSASRDLPYEEVRIMPVGDVQNGAIGADLDKFKRHMEWGMENGAYFLGMGDYNDSESPSGRRKVKQADFYDSTQEALDDSAWRAIHSFYECVKGTEGRWLGLLSGHHYHDFGNGTTTDTILANMLQAPHLKSCAFVRLKFKRTKTSSQSATIWCAHGDGGGNPLTKLAKVSADFEADIYMMGHVPMCTAIKKPRLYMGRQRPYTINHRTVALVATGGFMRGYTQGHSSYVERKIMMPTALGAPLVKVRPVVERGEGRIDINVEI